MMSLISREVFSHLLIPEHREEELAKARDDLLNLQELDSYQIIGKLAIIGECHKFNREPHLSEEAYLNAVGVIRTLGDEHLLSEAYESLGNALFFCKHYAKAVSYYRQTAAILDQRGEITRLITVLSQIAYAYSELGQRSEERCYLNTAVNQPNVDPVVRATLLERIALSLEADGKNEEAIDMYEQALSIFEAEDFRRDWGRRLQNLARLYSIVGDVDSASRIIDKLALSVDRNESL
jgi:tetratricopeptide (TPR) repeat protein